MFLRIFLLIVMATLSYAQPSISEIKAAISADPDLLNTPQAEALMKANGVTAQDIKARLAAANSSKQGDANKYLFNDINASFSEDNTTTLDNNITDMNITKEDNATKLLNPFAYKNNEELKKELLKLQLKQKQQKKLQRYAQAFFANANSIDTSALPTPKDYILAPSNELEIHVYGSKDKTFNLTITKDGSIYFPYIGPIKVGGLTFEDAQKVIQSRLKKNYKGSDFAISVAKYSPIQVILVGNVKFPGVYNLTSFSTVKDLLLAAKGIREDSSVRSIVIKRAGKEFAKIDLYDLLIKGDMNNMQLLQNGDVVVVKSASNLVSIDGAIANSAIYELKDNENLSDLIAFSGGLQAKASRFHIRIERYINNEVLDTFELALKDAKKYKIKNGDKIFVYPLDSLTKRNITLFGNIVRPGEYGISKNMTIDKFFKKYIKKDKKDFFLPNTALHYAVIKRYSKDLDYKTISFDLTKAIKGKKKIVLKANDELYIYAQDDIEASKFVKTMGDNLLHPGTLLYFKGMTLQDAVNSSVIAGIIDDKVRVTTYNTPDHTPLTHFYSLSKEGDVQLSAYDEIEVYDYYTKQPLEPVSIQGEVVAPIETFYEKGMTLEDLLKLAGGFTPMSYKKRVEIVRSYIDKNDVRQKKILDINLENKNLKDITIKPYDDVTIFKIPNWNNKKVVIIQGEVKFPGKYTIEDGEKLSHVLKRAGGFTKNAFIEGAVFTRESIRLNQIEQYQRNLSKIKRELSMYNAMPANSRQATNIQNISALNDIMAEARKYQPIGRVSIKLQRDLKEFEKSEYNIVLEDKDTVTIPTQKDTVTVFGEVFNPTSFIYNSDLDGYDYIDMASGLSRSADEDSLYVIHADGTSEPLESGWWIFTSYADIQKGDTIVAPVFIKEDRMLDIWGSVAKIMSSFAITAASLNTLGLL